MRPERRTAQRIGFLAGAAAFLLFILLPPFGVFEEAARGAVGTSAVDPAVLASSMQHVAGLLLLMVVWWITEAVPLPATALLPAVLLPLMHVAGVSGEGAYEFTLRNTLVNYAHPVIYLFLGGFLIAGTMQKWGVDRRLTLWLLTRGRLAGSARLILLAMMGVTALLSMWISNTACAAMMLPLGLGILRLMELEPGRSRFGTALMLGIAWAASIGGVGTIIGSPPNGIALGVLAAGVPGAERITFLDWMAFGVPYVILMIPLAWGVLVLLNPPEVDALPGGKSRLQEERRALGRMGRGEKLAVVLFGFAVLLWVTNPFWPAVLPAALAARLAWVDEYTIGLLAGVLCFLVPVGRGAALLEWKDAKVVDWGTLILFGGGIALSDAMFRTGLARWIATTVVGAVGSPAPIVMVLLLVVLTDFLTEVASNTAVTGMLAPVVISIGLTTGASPVTLVVATAVAASMAFMLPVATPPNALVYGTGYVSIREMVRNGFVLDILGWLMTVGVLYLFGQLLSGVLSFLPR